MRNYINDIEKFIERNLNYLIVMILTTVLVGFLLSLFILLSSIVYIDDNFSFFMGELSILFSLCIIPYICFKKFIYKKLRFSEKVVNLITWIIVAILGSLIWLDFETSLHFMVIAISEEILFREIYYQYLLKDDERNKHHVISAMFLVSFVFAIILHINDNFLINILVRFPFGLLLFVIRNKINLKSAILFHWLYDVIITLGV